MEIQTMLHSRQLFASATYYNTQTDTTVYPPPASYLEAHEGTTPSKKRKLNATDSSNSSENTGDQSRFPQRIVANPNLDRSMEAVKSECEEFITCCERLKLWININMPKMEDGDNFGVQVQEDVLSEVHRAHDAALNIHDSHFRHFTSRGKLASKLCKYPNVEDYATALKEHDLKQLYTSRMNLAEILNLHVVLTDLLHKNMTKILKPKGNNRGLMY